MDDRLLTRMAERIDRVTAAVGRAATWLALFIVVVQFAVVLMRYVLGTGLVWLTESISYAHAALFMMVAAWTLQTGGHVRVDIFYAQASARRKAIIDLAGALVFLLPFALAIFILSMPYVARSWAVLERSREASGLPAVFLLKTLIPVFALLLMMQGASQVIRCLDVFRGERPPEPSPASGGGSAVG